MTPKDKAHNGASGVSPAYAYLNSVVCDVQTQSTFPVEALYMETRRVKLQVLSSPRTSWLT